MSTAHTFHFSAIAREAPFTRSIRPTRWVVPVETRSAEDASGYRPLSIVFTNKVEKC